MRPQEKGSAKSWLLLDLAVSFMFCIFAPLEAYFSNESEYWFHLSHLLPVVLGVFVAVFSVLALFSAAIWRTKLNGAVYSLFLVFLIFLYVQGNYVPRPYGVFNGTEIDWNAEKFKFLAGASIALFVTALCVWCLVLALRPLRNRIFEIGRGVCLVLCGLQIVTLVTLYLQNNVLEDNSSPTLLMTTDKWLDLSPTNNVLIVLLDSFDGKDMNDILESPEGDFVRETLGDFTYYPDTLGLYPTTKGAVPHILTGQIYTNEMPFADYLDQAYGNAPLFKEMRHRGYSACVYSDLRFISRNVDVFENIYPGVSCISDKVRFANNLYRLVAFNYLPHQFKRHFVVSDDAFMALRESLSKATPYSKDMHKFFTGLRTSNVKLEDTGNAFRFYHVRGVHPPFDFGKDLVPCKGVKFSFSDASLGCVTLLAEFFKKLKDAQIYDVSTIIVMADHGHVRYSQNPLFLVKNKGERHEFRTSNAQMSFCYFPDLMMGLVRDGEDITEEGIAAFSKSSEERLFLFYRWDSYWKRNSLPIIREMRLKGLACLDSESSFVPTGRQYGGMVDETFANYDLGLLLDFDVDKRESVRPYLVSGFWWAPRDYTWTCDKEAIMRFCLNKTGRRLRLELTCGTYNGAQPVTIFANGTAIHQAVFSGHRTYTIPIPHSCIGKNRKLTLRFDLPKAIAPDDVSHNGNTRQLLALSFYEMRIYDLDDVQRPETTASFAGEDGAPARRLCHEGVGRSEKTFTWTVGNKLSMKLPVEPYPEKALSVTLQYGTFLPKERVVVSANGHEIGNYVAQGEEQRTFVIPPSCFSDDRTVTLSFSLPNAISPKELGWGGDTRKLALRLYSVMMR
jgi:hypothetical protein